ncbi:MAG: CoA transferase [Alphaproteobacteria bacterium]|nr:CoA transferase [Alphaproteobacteria bacterium]
MTLLSGLRVAQVGAGMAAAVSGRMFADTGAEVIVIGGVASAPFETYLDSGKRHVREAPARNDAIRSADLIICQGGPQELKARRQGADDFRRLNSRAAIVLISNYGQSGPKANDPASDLTLFCASGMARLLTGQVDDLDEAPLRPVGHQSAMIGGLAAACAGMHAVLAGTTGALIDVSIQEALATLSISELARCGLTGESWSRRRLRDGNGATVTVLPAKDGFVAISPREERQWAAWLEAMGSPGWGREARFATQPDRIKNWDALFARLCEWSCQYDKQWIADTAQAAHVPSFPLRELADHLSSAQLAHRGFYRQLEIAGRALKAPGAPFRLQLNDTSGTPDKRRPSPDPEDGSGPLPLSGVRVLDFSWVIAGPTATRHLAAMGADVIKVEAPGRGDPGRASELHTVLGQAKQSIVLDLKNASAVDIARKLAAKSDVLIENFATGVMERLGLGACDLQEINPNLIYLSASGLGRTGPEARKVAYGTLLQSYAGFPGLNRHPNKAPRVGFAWLDPMCGLMLPFVASAAVWRRQTGNGGGVRVDFSMIEAMLWTLAEPLLAAQLGAPPKPAGNLSLNHVPHGIYPSAGDDAWVGIAVTSDAQWHELAATVPGLSALSGLDVDKRMAMRDEIDRQLTAWTQARQAPAAAAELITRGIPAAALATSSDLVADQHLNARGFWDRHGDGVLPGLPWRASFGRRSGNAPSLGGDTDAVLQDVLGLTASEIEALRRAGAIGPPRPAAR